MRAMKRVDGKWLTETPDNLSKWLWREDGEEAIVIDDDAKVHYCARVEDEAKFLSAWAKERRKNDKRTVSDFYTLDRLLAESEPPADVTTSAAWCAGAGLLCSERGTCAGVVAGDCK